MPYNIEKSGDGYKVHSPTRSLSKEPLSKKKAQAQLRAVRKNTDGTKGESYERRLDAILTAGLGALDNQPVLSRASGITPSKPKSSRHVDTCSTPCKSTALRR